MLGGVKYRAPYVANNPDDNTGNNGTDDFLGIIQGTYCVP